MSYEAKILADSTTYHNFRLTTFEVTFPRFILAEVNTHRALSRNSASSRAIPTERQIEMVRTNPFVPVFNERVKGMGVGNELDHPTQLGAQKIWRKAAENACDSAETLLHVDKSRANRLLEPFAWHTAIISGTEWWNFFNLRTEGAQPEMMKIAGMMKELYLDHKPKFLGPGKWHLPLTFEGDYVSGDQKTAEEALRAFAEVSAGRCAKVSYNTQNDEEAADVSRARWNKLWPNAHWSPGEHPAQCLPSPERVGNYVGWKQLRKFYPNEAVFDG